MNATASIAKLLIGMAAGLGSSAPGHGAEFPLGVWVQNPTNAPAYRAAGINTFVNLWMGPTAEQLTQLQHAGMKVICRQNETALRHSAASNIIAWMHPDEPDNAPNFGARLGFGRPISPTQIQAEYRAMKQRDPGRPVFLNLGQGVAWDAWYGRGRRNNRREDYPEYVKGADICSFDLYPANHDSPEIAGNLWYIATGIQRLRQWSQNQKSVWCCVETGRIDRAGRKPTPVEVRAQAWMAIIHGARGLIYFVHQFEPDFIEAALLQDAEMLAAVAALNRQIAELAPVLFAPDRAAAISAQWQNPAVPIAKTVRHWNNGTYLFAVAMRPGTNVVTFSGPALAGAPQVEVLGEERTRVIENGAFTDSFAPWEVHLYRVGGEAGH